MSLRGALVRHWPLKLAALALSVILWVVVALEKPSTQLVGVELDLVLAPEVVAAQLPPPIKAVVSGPRRELLKLPAALLIRAAIPESGAGAGTRHHLAIVPSDVQIPGGVKVTVQEVEPREIELVLDRRAQKTVAVRAVVQPDSGWTLDGPVTVAPAEVRVSGPRSLVATLDTLATQPLELKGVMGPFAQSVPLDTTGRAVLRIAPVAVTLSGRTRKT